MQLLSRLILFVDDSFGYDVLEDDVLERLLK